MNHLLNITKKELKELLTPGTIISILLVVILLSAVGSAMSGSEEDSSSPKDVGIVYNSAGGPDETIISCSGQDYSLDLLLRLTYVSTYYENADSSALNYLLGEASHHIHYLSAEYGNGKEITKMMEKEGCDYAISIPNELKTNIAAEKRTLFSSYYTYSNGGLFSTVTSTSGTIFVSNMNSVLSELLIISSSTLSADFVESPLKNESNTEVNGVVYDDLTPYEIYSSMMGQNMIVPIIVMIVIVMVGSIVISSMGSEKENKTLETLLTMPIKRTTIVSGKLLAAAVMGLVYGICYLAGMMFYSNGLTGGLTESVDLGDYGIAMEPLDWLLLMIVLFLAIFSALGICMTLGAFTKNYKMAQTMTLPISGLAVIPMFIFMFTSWENLPVAGQALMFIIPFTHPMIGMDNLMFGNLDLVLEGMVYLVAFDIIMILITVKIYNSDILITGLEQSKSIKTIKKLFKIREKEHEDSRDN